VTVDHRPALVLAQVHDEERRRRLMVLASAIEAPPPGHGLSPVAAALTAVVVGAVALLLA